MGEVITLRNIVLIIVGIVSLIIIGLYIRMRYFKKLVDIQDEVCLDLLSEAAENNRMMLAMGLVSEEGFEKQKQKLMDYTDALIKGGVWGDFLMKKRKENNVRNNH